MAVAIRELQALNEADVKYGQYKYDPDKQDEYLEIINKAISSLTTINTEICNDLNGCAEYIEDDEINNQINNIVSQTAMIDTMLKGSLSGIEQDLLVLKNTITKIQMITRDDLENIYEQ